MNIIDFIYIFASMEKKEEIFKEASLEAQQEQARIIFNQPIYVNANGKTIKIRPLTAKSQIKIATCAIRQTSIDVEEATAPNLIALTRKNLKSQCQAASYATLNDNRLYGFAGNFKRFFFHWINWRIIMNSWDSGIVNEVFVAMVEKYGLRFFFQNSAMILEMNNLRKKKTKEEVESLVAEQKSE